MNYMKVLMAGYVAQEPKIQAVGVKKTTLAKFCLGVRVDKDRDTEFVDCDLWGKQAEVFAQYVSKGSNIFVEGQLETSKWKDQNGQEKKKQFVKVRNFSFISDGSRSGASDSRPKSEAVADDNF